MMVDIWSVEKTRMYGTPQLVKLAQEDVDAIQQIQGADYEQEEYESAYDQYDDDNNDFCDIDGNDAPTMQKSTEKVIPPIILAPVQHGLPGINDDNHDVNEYLHSTYPDQCKDSTACDYVPIEVCEKWTYEQFPLTCKASYKRDDNIVVKYDIKRHAWEPYQWFFETIQWSNCVDNADANNTITFCELAIIAHILTDGATSGSQDLCIATKLMKAAFMKYHKQKFRYNGKISEYKQAFAPNGKLKNLVYIGSEQMPGISRKPMIDKGMRDDVRVAVWRAAQLWRASPNEHFGQGAFLHKSKKSVWKPSVMHWAETMCDLNKGIKADAKCAAISKPAVNMFSRQAPIPEQPICFYGHRATSTVGPSGKMIWRKAPMTPWKHVPPGRILCQKCYQAHRIAHESNQSQCIIHKLYMPGHPDGIPSAELGGYASAIADQRPVMIDLDCLSAPTTTLDPDFECDICALDIFEGLTLFSYHMAWFRLGEKCFKHPSHDNNDMLSTSTARPPGADHHL
jgi:hypothetical protein